MIVFMGLEGKWGRGGVLWGRNGESSEVFQCGWSAWLISSMSIVLAWLEIICK
jgi:hypothetical protein